MLRSKFMTGFLVLAAMSIVGIGAYAQTAGQPVPTMVNYQGRLSKGGGTLVEDGTYELTFRLYSSLSGGTKQWEERHTSIVVKNGVFSVLLGSFTALDQSLFANPVYLEIQVGTATPLQPRQPIAAVPFALRTEVARTAVTVPDASITSPKLADGSVTEAKLVDGGVSGVKLKSNAVTSAKIIDGGVATVDIAAAAITAAKLADGSVGNQHLGNGVVNESKLADGSVSNIKLANDSNSLEKVTGGKLRVGSGNIEAGYTAFGLAHNEQFTYNGFSHSNYGFQFVPDNEWTGAPLATISSWRGIKFFSDSALKWSLDRGGAITQYGSFYINNHGFGGNASVDLALGDTDTGFKWVGDGAYDLYANNTVVAEVRPDRFTVKVSKQGAVETKNYGERALYATEGADCRFTDEGTAAIKNGKAVITIDPIFLETTDGLPHISITPYGNSLLYVDSVKRSQFTIRARNGEKDVAFSWRASYVRKGYQGVRLEKH